MSFIKNSGIGISPPLPLKMALAGVVSVLAISTIALSIIGLTASASGPFNGIVQWGIATHGSLFGVSTFLLTADIICVAHLVSRNSQSPTILSDVPASEQVYGTDFFNQLPEEVQLLIFSFLNIKQLIKCTTVCRDWQRVLSDPFLWNNIDLRKISTSLRVFDESDWASHVDISYFGLDLTDVPPLDKSKIIPTLSQCLSSLPIEAEAGITLLTIPKGLTISTLLRICASPKKGNIASLRPIDDKLVNEIGDTPVDKTYRIVITNKIFKLSRFLPLDKQQALVSKYSCRPPKALEAITLLVVTFMQSGALLYSGVQSTFTSCFDQSRLSAIVGVTQDVINFVGPSCFQIHDVHGAAGVLKNF